MPRDLGHHTIRYDDGVSAGLHSYGMKPDPCVFCRSLCQLTGRLFEIIRLPGIYYPVFRRCRHKSFVSGGHPDRKSTSAVVIRKVMHLLVKQGNRLLILMIFAGFHKMCLLTRQRIPLCTS